MKTRSVWILIAALLALILTSKGFAQGTAFTYQGRLSDNAGSVNGSYDFSFQLFDAVSGGASQGSLLSKVGVTVSDGLFTVTLDFGSSPFSAGAARWMEISVRTNGGGAFGLISPRLQLTPTPYAVMAGNISGPVASTSLAGTYSNALTLNNPANSVSGAFTGNGVNVTNVNAATLSGLTSGSFWKTNGNAGVNPTNGAFLGTTDNFPLEIKVNGQRAFRFESATNDFVFSPNLIGGYSGNQVSNGVIGAFIGGGGQSFSPNRVGGNFAVVVGGIGNTVNGVTATAMGQANTVDGNFSTAIGGGNSVSGVASSAIGLDNVVSGGFSTAIGLANIASGENATAIGRSTTASAIDSTAMGFGTTASGGDSTAMGRETIAGGTASMAVGTLAKALHEGSFVWADHLFVDFASTTSNQFRVRATGGVQFETAGTGMTVDAAPVFTGLNASSLTNFNAAQLASGTVPNGVLSNAWKTTGNAGTIPGSQFIGTSDNQPLEIKVNGQRAFRIEPNVNGPNIIGGYSGNLVSNGIYGAFIGGGGDEFGGPNLVGGHFASVLGGRANIANGVVSTAMGEGNVASGANSTAMGRNTVASGLESTAMGSTTLASGDYSMAFGDGTQAGGRSSTAMGSATMASGNSATAMGWQSRAAGTTSFAAGFGAQASGDGSFVWSDFSSFTGFGSTASNVFLIRAAGGVGIGLTAPAAALDVNGTVRATSLVTSGGNVGINTVNPIAGLHVNATAVLGGAFAPTTTTASNLLNLAVGVNANGFLNGISFYESAAGSAMSLGYDGSGSVGNNALRIYNQTGAELVSFLDGGNVGIGTRNPSRELEVQRIGDTEVGIKSTDTGGHLWTLQSSGLTGSANLDASFQIIDRTSGGARLLIGTNGDVGIGTTSPALKLTVGGAGNFLSKAAAAIMLDNTTANGRRWEWHALDDGRMQFLDFDASATRLLIDTNGNVGIGVSVPTNRLHVGGGISATAFVTTSDRNAKENFTEISPAEVLAKVASLPITKWNFKEMKDGAHLGPMAQDFYAAFGLGGGETTITTVDADGVALAAIQGLNQKLDEKDSRIRELETRLEKLERLLKGSSNVGHE